MKLGVLFSGGKDSTYAAWLAKKEGYEISCLISLVSENPHSFMFHTPSINATEYQARAMGIPIIIQKTKGKKELELRDLRAAIKKAIKGYGIEGIVTGAVESVYQSSRIQKICNELDLECFNPLWQKDQIELLQDLVKDKFEVMIVGVFAYPLDKSWLGRIIDKKFIDKVAILKRKYQINPAGEGGEFETLTLFAPDLFKKRLKIKSFQDFYEGENAGRREVRI